MHVYISLGMDQLCIRRGAFPLFLLIMCHFSDSEKEKEGERSSIQAGSDRSLKVTKHCRPYKVIKELLIDLHWKVEDSWSSWISEGISNYQERGSLVSNYISLSDIGLISWQGVGT